MLFAGVLSLFIGNQKVAYIETTSIPLNYKALVDSVNSERKQLKSLHASNDKLKKSFLANIDQRIFTAWYGTKWDFNGTTEIPNKGSIACGYFVTTTLRDMGIKINRIKMAQCPSEEMIKSLVSEKYIKRFSNVKAKDFETKLQKTGTALYVIGLDNHTGFVFISDKGNYFIHASGWYPFKVIKEDLGTSDIIDHSAYKVVGNLTGSEEFLRNWVND